MWERGSEFLFTAQETTARNTLETTNDESIDLLRSTIETPAAGQEHVKEKGPITWLCVRDQLISSGYHLVKWKFFPRSKGMVGWDK
eukprot:m.299778 g.299778  ORF g.299778 m.299778 type:complete len:86 (-) comp16415_c0_seq69:1235-1492(-)